MSDQDSQRRSFTSRTPTSSNPEHVRYRRGFVTRHQVSGWRFVMRRIASAIALHDARMLVDPLRTQSRAVAVGVLLAITGLVGSFVFSLIRPNSVPGNDIVLADKSTSALYVHLGDRLHPVLNLTSARLIAGSAVNPTMVRSSELDQFVRGNLVGIPGAPDRMVQNSTRDSDWTVCHGRDGTTVIAGAPDMSDGRATDLPAGGGILAAADEHTWLLWGGRRSPIDLNDRPVTTALGLEVVTPPVAIDTGLFNVIPEAPALTAPFIPEAGSQPRFELPVPAPVGAVVTAYAPDSTSLYYVVLPEGLQPISRVLATMLRNVNSYGLTQPPQLSADEVARMPLSRAFDSNTYPAGPIDLADPATAPVTCARWTRQEEARNATLTILSGSSLPLKDSSQPVELVTGGPTGAAHRVAMSPGSGYFVSTTAGQFWLSDTGVRYGIDAEDPTLDTAAAIGLEAPPIPISPAILSLFAPGPTLSRADALLAHDGLTPGLQPARRIEGQP